MHDFLLWPIIGNRGILLISNSETCFYHDCNLAIEGTATICLVSYSPCIRFNVIYTTCSFIIGWCLLVTQERTLPRIGTLQKSRKTQYIAMHQWPKSLCAWNTVYCNITQQQDIFHKAHITLVNLHLYNRYRLMPCRAKRCCCCENCALRGVTRLDGVRGKKQVWRPQVRTCGLSEANALYWRKYLWHCWDFSAPPAGIRHPHDDSAHGEMLPLAPLVTSLCALYYGPLFRQIADSEKKDR